MGCAKWCPPIAPAIGVPGAATHFPLTQRHVTPGILMQAAPTVAVSSLQAPGSLGRSPSGHTARAGTCSNSRPPPLPAPGGSASGSRDPECRPPRAASLRPAAWPSRRGAGSLASGLARQAVPAARVRASRAMCHREGSRVGAGCRCCRCRCRRLRLSHSKSPCSPAACSACPGGAGAHQVGRAQRE